MSGAPHSQEKTEVDRKRKTSPTFLEFDGAGAEGGGGARVVSKLLRENPPEEGASTLKGDISQFLNEVRKATGDAPTVLESAQGRTGTAPLVEINLAIDDLVEVKDIPEIAAKAPHTRDGILLPTERTDAYMDETKFHQKQSLTKMVCRIFFFESEPNFAAL